MNTDNIIKTSQTSLAWRNKQKHLVSVLMLGFACMILPSMAVAQNSSPDPDPDVEKGSYLSLILTSNVVAVGTPLSGSATIYEGDGDVDSDDNVTVSFSASNQSNSATASAKSAAFASSGVSTQSGSGTVNFSFATSGPGDYVLDAATKDVSDQVATGHVIGGSITGDVSDVRIYADGSAPTVTLTANSNQPAGTTYAWSATTNTPGSGAVIFQGSTTSSTAVIKGATASGIPDDVTVTLTYTFNTTPIPTSQQLTVRTPTYIVENKTTPATEFHYNDINDPVDKAYGYSFGGGFNPNHDQQTLWALQDQFSLGMDKCTVGETWNFVQQATDNHSVYPTPDGKWAINEASSWGTLAGGVFDDTDHFATFRHGRDSADPNNFHFLADFNKTHDIGSATHEFHAYTPNQAGPILKPTFLTTYYADHADWALSY